MSPEKILKLALVLSSSLDSGGAWNNKIFVGRISPRHIHHGQTELSSMCLTFQGSTGSNNTGREESRELFFVEKQNMSGLGKNSSF